ncbi:hypothetical protein HG535_0F04350 [Zygotorulaspora mrakii]|uniref:Uncharacterized protein n=1 Tax=Zygotorulaspora mrakii TaxID=42260 RepID=A0A7H9B600_ZYGMR|nr:uncharacterized protein HG535_0F04350 [Zygotorulaspora mrakii]QLG73923.1 hypothetical protein HG535_0F04350 [Zygotorulaspora mrakii]
MEVLRRPNHSSRLVMEKQDPIDCDLGTTSIPKKVFKSRLTFFCYAAVRSRGFHILLLLLAFLSVSLFFLVDDLKSNPAKQFIYFMGLVVGVSVGALLVLCYRVQRIKHLVSHNLTIFMEIVETVFEPGHGIGPERWDVVACEMNRELYEIGLWKTPYCFFEGLDLEKLYRYLVLKPQFEQNLDQFDVLEKGHGQTSSYQQALDEQFSSWVEVSDTSIEDSERKLPRDSCWSKFTWTVHKMIKLQKQSILVQVVCLLNFFSLVQLIAFFIVMMLLYKGIQEFQFFQDTPMLTSKRLRFLATITSVAPGTNLDRWDVIAKRMNSYLRENTRSCDCFYDGKDCLKFFENNFKPLTSKKGMSTEMATYELVPFVLKAGEVCY